MAMVDATVPTESTPGPAQAAAEASASAAAASVSPDTQDAGAVPELAPPTPSDAPALEQATGGPASSLTTPVQREAGVDDADGEASAAPSSSVGEQSESDGSNLIINYLPATLTQEGLHNLFVVYGPIESSKLMVDKVTGESLGYGFVKFVSPDDARRAVDEMNHRAVSNKRLKVSYARPASEDIKNANLYVSGLPSSYTPADLDELFRPYGEIIDSKVLLDRLTKQSRGVGFVRFDRNVEAQQAIASLHGRHIVAGGPALTVKFAESTDDKQRKRVPRPPIGGPSKMQDMIGFPDVYVGQPPYMGPSQVPGYAGAPGAAAGQGYIAAGTANSPGFCLFVYHLPPEADETLLYRLFSPYGAIVSVKVMRDFATLRCKGYGFVNMAKIEEAQASIVALNGHRVSGKHLSVSFKTDRGTKHPGMAGASQAMGHHQHAPQQHHHVHHGQQMPPHHSAPQQAHAMQVGAHHPALSGSPPSAGQHHAAMHAQHAAHLVHHGGAGGAMAQQQQQQQHQTHRAPLGFGHAMQLVGPPLSPSSQHVDTRYMMN